MDHRLVLVFFLHCLQANVAALASWDYGKEVWWAVSAC